MNKVDFFRESQPRVAIYGAGAMGTVLGALLNKSGFSVDLITRNTAHIRALNENGARVSGAANFTVPVNAFTPDKMAGKYDVVFLMTKQGENAVNAAYIGGNLSENGVVCVMQNGLPEDSVAEVVGKDRCIGCAVSFGAALVKAGEAALTSNKITFALGSPYGENARIETVKNILSLAGKVSVCRDFSGARWGKLIINSAFSTLSAMTGLTFGEIAKGKIYKRLALSMIKEAIDAARADGVTRAKVQGHDIIKLLNYNSRARRALSLAVLPVAMAKHKKSVSGMYYDLKKGKKCEIDYIAGAVINKAKSHGVSVPITQKAVEIIHDIESGRAAISPSNAETLYALFFATRKNRATSR